MKHFTGEPFIITRRHYDVVIDQAQKNLPKETGGFFGGHGRYIKGILPLFNMHLGDKTGTFAYTPEDAVRARQFFEKNSLEYLGVYHTHPKGTADPSNQDLTHIQKFMFIISMRRPQFPDFACYEVQGKRYNRVPLNISDETVSIADIHASKKEASTQPLDTTVSSTDSLHFDGLFDAIINDQTVDYPKYTSPFEGDDSFSTLA